MAQISHFPHVTNVQAGRALYDPLHNSIFEVTFTLPEGILVLNPSSPDILTLLSEQVTTVQGLDALQKTPAAGSQRFQGADVSFINPVHDQTYADITIEFNLNITDANDVYVLNVFKAWTKLNYDLASGRRVLKKNYVAPFLTIKQANRDGSIWRTVNFQHVMLTSCTGVDSLDYTSNEPFKLSCVFRCDYWDEKDGDDKNPYLDSYYALQ